MRRLLLLAVSAALLLSAAPTASALPSGTSQAGRSAQDAASPTVAPGVRGGDLSWPNCPKGMGVPGRRTQGLPLPWATAKYWILGLTNGRAFTRNPCLA